MLFFLVPSVFGQSLEKNYSSFQCQGEIPFDFKSHIAKKIKKEKRKHPQFYKGKSGKYFLLRNTNAIDQLLKSGLVTYGDPISQYASKIADKLLKKDPKLRSEIRIYALKSTIPNALSTNEGIIFITTGLVEKLKSDDELAFILGHEIMHYKFEHVKRAYTFNQLNKYEGLEKLMAYSRDNELEADKEGYKLCIAAGYKKQALLKVFKLLKFSHMPPEEHFVSPYYLSNDKFIIPNSKLVSKVIEINTLELEEEKDKSTHPTCDLREKKLNEFDSISISSFEEQISSNELSYIVSLSQFETIRLSIIEKDYAKALYMIYCLEKKFPENMFLREMKALTWLNLIHARNSKQFKPNPDNEQGEIGRLQTFLFSLNSKEMTHFGLQNIYHVCKSNPENRMLKKIWDVFKIELRNSENFRFKILKESSLNANDSTFKDSSDYYLYNFESFINSDEDFRKVNFEFKKNTKKEWNSVYKNSVVFNLNYSVNRNLGEKRYERTQRSINKGIEVGLKEGGQNSQDNVSRLYFTPDNTVTFNESNTMAILQYSLSEADLGTQFIPVDYNLILDISEKYNSKGVLYVRAYEDKMIFPYEEGMGVLGFYIGTIYFITSFPYQLIMSQETSLKLHVFDIETLTEKVENIEFSGNTRKYAVASYIYDYFNSEK